MLEKASTTYASISITPFVLNSIYKYHELKEKDVYIREFIDISEKYFGKSYCDIPIHKNIDCKSDKYFVIPTRNHKAIKDRLLAAGVSEEKILTLPPPPRGGAAASKIDIDQVINLLENIYDTNGGGLSELKRIRRLGSQNEDNVILNTFDIFVTEYCTLRCDGCVDQIQYVKRPMHIPFDEIKRDVTVLMSNVDFVNYIHILGGEPLLYPQITELVRWILQSSWKNKVGYFNIVTNGTMMPTDSLIEVISGSNIGIYISDYGKLSKKADELLALCKNHRVRCLKLEKANWFAAAQLLSQPDVDSSINDKKFIECINKGNGCKFIRGGKFYYCPFLCMGEALGLFPHSSKNSVDMISKDFSKEVLRKYLESKTAPPGCAYCNGYGMAQISKKIPTAKQLQTPKEYVAY